MKRILFLFLILAINVKAQYAELWHPQFSNGYLVKNIALAELLEEDRIILERNNVKTVIISDNEGVCDSILVDRKGRFVAQFSNHTWADDYYRLSFMNYIGAPKRETAGKYIYTFSFNDENMISFYKDFQHDHYSPSFSFSYRDKKLDEINNDGARIYKYYYNDSGTLTSINVYYPNKIYRYDAFYDDSGRVSALYDSLNNIIAAQVKYYTEESNFHFYYSPGNNENYYFLNKRLAKEYSDLTHYDGSVHIRRLYGYRKDRLIESTIEQYTDNSAYIRNYNYKFYEE